MARVRGIGGIFFKSDSPENLYGWYEKHLGISRSGNEGVTFRWRHPDDPAKEEITAWAIFPSSTKYFGNGHSTCMLNYIVDDLTATLRQLREEGVEIDERVEDYDYGKFGWITDPDGNRIELWEPK
ncbi:MAG: VOC family protein [Acidobacteriaceae bacterium]|nr:VOC family protein [Acidobacteriaceae bacterium]